MNKRDVKHEQGGQLKRKNFEHAIK